MSKICKVHIVHLVYGHLYTQIFHFGFLKWQKRWGALLHLSFATKLRDLLLEMSIYFTLLVGGWEANMLFVPCILVCQTVSYKTYCNVLFFFSWPYTKTCHKNVLFLKGNWTFFLEWFEDILLERVASKSSFLSTFRHGFAVSPTWNLTETLSIK